ncbi:fructose-bisphosphate aldolase class II/tagatose 1,6-diphosphate aldolase GatY/KbaY [Melghirimyces profundicolus]|uniref:Fructose-bisphosphate aldolase class II/tagatose 1,6-diphosphate aldolase GatY/KbaY n=1 Tax=Melghirimyces profundicolus TaxID=1242148 RepID=A0A2T6C9A8_9BACL|nr:class II fructose-bisphosphate aldolase [Melghirimyces profundicolus]PTX64910.1 fructose-bisphosphate aldolase class II/tagatose 1,6-diphosphate aldolase GatY/KbaY [Melghirimyces profundicolus]
MPLVSTKEMLEDARRNGFAVPAFPAHHLDIIRSVVDAADDMRSPVILQTTPATLEKVGIDYVTALVRTAAKRVSVPVALHLDHGNSYATVARCLRMGYTSVMIDGSHLPYRENVALVRRVVEMAHAVGVPVESELGAIGAANETPQAHSSYTDPIQAKEFVETTGTDFLAPAFGTAHGVYRRGVRLDLTRLKAISRQTGVPLVMHGASGVPMEDIRRSIQSGIAKINFSTELKQSFSDSLRDYLTQHPEENDPRKIFGAARERLREVIRQKISWMQPAAVKNKQDGPV